MPTARRRRRLAAALLAAGCAAGPPRPAAADGPFASEDGGVRSALTRSHRFALPVGGDLDRTGLAAVRLYRSTDAGTSWEPAGTFAPATDRIEQEVPRDGDYWFAVRGLDRRGETRPAGPLGPEFRVTVDATPPRLALKGWWADEDRVRVTLRAEDGGLVRDSVRIRYLPADPAVGWTDLTPSAAEATSWDGLVRADLTRTVETPFDLTVRATATDAAGNEATATLALPRPATADTAADGAAVLSFAAADGFADAGRDRRPVPRFGPPPAVARPLPAARPLPVPAAAIEPGGLPVARFAVPVGDGFPIARFAVPGGPEPALWDEPAAGDGPSFDAAVPLFPAAPAFVPPPSEPLADGPAVPTVRPAGATAEAAPPGGPGAVNRLYERLLAAAPGDRGLRRAYVDRLLAVGDRAAAAVHLRALLRADPGDAAALRDLTDCLAPPAGPR